MCFLPMSGNGTFRIGKDVQPGTYRTRSASSGRYYAQLRALSGSLDDILADAFTNAPAIITIAPSDKGFQAQDCGIWKKT